MRIAMSLLFASLLSLTGCVVESEQPLYTEKDIIFDANLLGEWADKKGGEKIQIERSGDSAYLAGFVGEKGKCVVHLLRLGEALFLDIEGDKEKDKHLIMRVWIKKNLLRLSTLENGWLRKRIAAKEVAGDGQELLLAASTADLQAFLLHHLKNPEAFDKPDTYVRIK